MKETLLRRLEKSRGTKTKHKVLNINNPSHMVLIARTHAHTPTDIRTTTNTNRVLFQLDLFTQRSMALGSCYAPVPDFVTGPTQCHRYCTFLLEGQHQSNGILIFQLLSTILTCNKQSETFQNSPLLFH